MTSFEAVQLLARRARHAARVGWGIGVLAIVAIGVGALGVQLAIAERPSKARGLMTAYITVGAASVILSVVRFGVKLILQLRRPTWIEDLARQEGLDAKKISESFTLDSW